MSPAVPPGACAAPDGPRGARIGPVGVAGCGAMGLPMARALAGAGFEVWGLDVRPAAQFGDFAPRMLDDPATFAARCPVVLSVVRDIAQTRALCFEEQALFRQPRRPHTLVICSTLSPRVLPELRAALPAAVALVDAPMSGAPHAAEAAALTFMLGGDTADLERLQPLFEAMGARLFRLGPLGAGMTAKVLNNYAACTSVVAVRRILERARALGVALPALREVMSASSGATWFGDHFDAIAWARQGYAPDNTIGILEKDLNASLDALAGLPGVAADEFDRALLAALRAMPADDAP